MKKEKSIVLLAPHRMEEREFRIPEIGSKDLLLKIEMTAICGTDPKTYEGKFTDIVYPLILGHEIVGFVEAIGEMASYVYGVNIGDRVTVEPYIMCKGCFYCLNGHYNLCIKRRCYGFTIPSTEPPFLWGGYGEYLFVCDGSRVHKISKEVPAEAACLSSVMGNGIRWVRTKAQVKFGESVVILGPGAQGLVSVIAAAEAGANPIIVVGLSVDHIKLKLAQEFGAHFVINAEKDDPVSVVKKITGEELADVVIECSGSKNAISLGLDLIKPLGRYVIAGLTGGAAVPLVTDKFASKELKILGGWGQAWDVDNAVRIINAKKYPIEKIITHTFQLADAEKAINFFSQEKEKCIRSALRP
jgi:2-desacetyl-2-hydroxyethyl bacteriochlorophyllide A dehydrogenase